MNDPAIACSLTADELPARLADASELGRRGLLDVRTDGSRAQLRFKDDPEVRAGVHHLVAAESKCCPFFEFEVREDGDATVLAIEAPGDGAWALRGLVAGVVTGWELPA